MTKFVIVFVVIAFVIARLLYHLRFAKTKR